MAKFWVGPLRRFPEPNGPWGVDYKDLAGKRKRKSWGHKKRDGEQGRRKLIRELEDGTHAASSTKTMGDALDLLLEDDEIRCRRGDLIRGSIYTRRKDIEKHVRPSLSKIRLHDEVAVRAETQALIDRLVAAGYKRVPIQCVTVTKLALDLAVYRGWIAINPFVKKRMRLPPEPAPDTYCPTFSEGKAIWHLVQKRQPAERNYEHLTRVAVFALAMFAGLRRGEVAGLQWEDIDFVNGILKVRRSWKKFGVGLGETKNRMRRTVPMASEIREALTRIAERDGWPREGYVLKNRDGGVIYGSISENYFGLPMRHAGFVKEDGNPKWRYHDLRHYAGSIWLMNGLSLYEVSRLLGHRSINTTERVYAHMLDELSQARQVMDRVSEQHRLSAPIRDSDEADAEDVENVG